MTQWQTILFKMYTFTGQRKKTTRSKIHVTCIQGLEVCNLYSDYQDRSHVIILLQLTQVSCPQPTVKLVPLHTWSTSIRIKHWTASGMRESNWDAKLKVWTFGKPCDTKSSGCVKCQQHLIWPLSSEGYVKNELQMHTMLNKQISFCENFWMLAEINLCHFNV